VAHRKMKIDASSRRILIIEISPKKEGNSKLFLLYINCILYNSYICITIYLNYISTISVTSINKR